MCVKSAVSRRGRKEREEDKKETVSLNEERTVVRKQLIEHLVSAGRKR